MYLIKKSESVGFYWFMGKKLDIKVLLNRRVNYLFLIVICIFILSFWLLIKNQERSLVVNTNDSLRSVLESSYKSVIIWINNNKKVITNYSSNISLSSNIEDSNKTLQELIIHNDIEDYYIISENFDIKLSSNEKSIGRRIFLTESRQEFLVEALEGKTVFVPAILRDNKPFVYFITPLKNVINDELSLLVFEIDYYHEFYELTEIGRIGKTGETYLFDSKGRLITESRFEAGLQENGILKPKEKSIFNVLVQDPGGDTTKGFTVTKKNLQFTLMAESALKGQSGGSHTAYNDYRGVPVYGQWLWSDELQIGLTTEINADEVQASIKKTFFSVVLISLLLILLGIFLNYIIIAIQKEQIEVKNRAYKKYLSLFETSLDAIIVFTIEDFIIKECNNTAKEMFNITGSYNNLNPIELVYGFQVNNKVSIKEMYNYVTKAIEGESVSFVMDYRGVDSSTIQVSINIIKIHIDNKVQLQLSIRDISIKVEAESRLKESQERLLESQEIAQVGSWVWDIEKDEVILSDVGCKILDLKEGDNNLEFSEILKFVPEDERVRVRDLIYKSIDNRSDFKILHKIITKNSKAKYLTNQGRVEYSSDFSAKKIVGTIQDITDIKHAELELQVYKDHLEELVNVRTSELDSVKNSIIQEKAILDSLIDSLPTIFLLLDDKGNILRCNQNFISITGYNPEVDVANISSLFKDNQNIFENVTLFVKAQFEAEITSVNFEKLPFLFSITPVNLDNEIRSVWIGTDLSDLRSAMDQIRKLSQVVEQSPDSIIITDIEGDIEYVNSSFSDVTGYLFSDVKGRNTRILKSGEMSEELYRQLWETISSGKVWKGELINKSKYGDLFWESCTISPIKNADQQIVSYLAIMQNINEKKLLEESVRSSEKRYRTLFEQAGDAIVLLAIDTGKIVDFNKQAYVNLGYTKNEFELLSMGDLEVTDSLDSFEIHKNNISENGYDHYDTELKKNNGEIVYASINSRNIKINETEYIQSIWRDISSTKKMEDELRRAKEEAESSSMVKSMFLANMSHEIRTPINSIIGFIELVLDNGDLTVPDKEYLDISLSSAKSLLTLINDILDISKLESGKLNIEYKPFNIHRMLKGVIKLMSYFINEKSINLEMNSIKDIPHCIVGDSTRIRQVLINLLGNAIKFTEQGYVRLEVKNIESEYLEFNVTDTGIGMTEDQINEVFKPFSQADYSTIRKYGGTGLGTTISKELVNLMGGEISVESKEGEGSKFTFNIPYNLPECISDCSFDCEEFSDGEIKQIKVNKPSEGLRILVAEDIKENAMLLQIRLQNYGYKIVFAENGQEAIDLYIQDKFDLILMDVHMPIMDGLEATRIIRELEEGSHIPIIALTASVMEDERKRCIEAGMDDIVSKPIIINELYRAINMAMDNPSSNSESQPLVDIDKGIELWQDKDLYYSSLKSFIEKFSKSPLELESMINKGNVEEAIDLIHTVKGVSGNLRINQIYTISTEINRILKLNELENINDLIKTFQEAMDKSVVYIKGLSEAEGNKSADFTKISKEEIKVLIEDFIIHLKRGEIHNDKYVELLLALKNTVSEDLLSSLEESIETYNFNKSVELLTALLE